MSRLYGRLMDLDVNGGKFTMCFFDVAGMRNLWFENWIYPNTSQFSRVI